MIEIKITYNVVDGDLQIHHDPSLTFMQILGLLEGAKVLTAERWNHKNPGWSE